MSFVYWLVVVDAALPTHSRLGLAAQREGEKICVDCEEQVYCGRCWTMAHKEEDMAGHVWKGADSGKYCSETSRCSAHKTCPCQSAIP